MTIIRIDTVDSTNTYLKSHYRELPHFSVVSAKHQTFGRGRLSRIWQDDGTMALFSILLKSDLDLKRMDLMSLIACVSVHRVLIQYLPSLQIKWPNDLVVNDLKLCGILTESIIENQTIACLVIGIGINVQTEQFPDDLKTTATSLYRETHNKRDIDQLIDEILIAFKITLEAFYQNPNDVITYCDKYSSLKGRMIDFYDSGKKTSARVIGFAPDGSLNVQTSKGNQSLRSGEVTLSKPKP